MIIIKMCDPSFLLSTCVQLLVSLSMNNVGSCGSQSGNCHREDGRVLPCQEPGSLSHIFQYNMLLWCDNAELIIYSRFTLSPVFLEAAVQQLVWKKEAGWRSKQIWFFHFQYCWYSQRDTTHRHCFDHGSNTSWQTQQVPSDIQVPLETKSSTSKFGTKMWFVLSGNESHRKMISIYLGEVWPIQTADRGLRFHILIII